MSTDKENHKSEEMKVDEKGDAKQDPKKIETNDKGVDKEVKDEKEDKSSDESEPGKMKKETPKKSTSKAKEAKEEKREEDEDEEDEDNEDDKGDDDDDEKPEKKLDKDGKVPLLDQPLQVSGARERKKVERFAVDKNEMKEISAVEIPEGKGVALGNIGIIENNISKHRGDDLKKFHQVLFGRPGKATLIKKNIRKFNGFDFDKDTEQYERKKSSLAKLEVKYLKDMAGILDLTKGGSREELAARLLDFLMEPKGAGAVAPVVIKGGLTRGGRPKRSAAAKANNKGYSESDDDGDRAPRSRRSKGKRPNLKDESSSEDEKVKNDEGEEEEEPEKDDKGSDEDVIAEEETPSSDESDDPKSKKKRAPPPPKASSKKSKKKSIPAKKEKPSPKKRKPDTDEEESSEDDQPLVKKVKAPPTDDEIKTFVKEILEGANLEEITMKTVCKQVYSHYPEFDLAHKKDFIKTTVKSLIST